MRMALTYLVTDALLATALLMMVMTTTTVAGLDRARYETFPEEGFKCRDAWSIHPLYVRGSSFSRSVKMFGNDQRHPHSYPEGHGRRMEEYNHCLILPGQVCYSLGGLKVGRFYEVLISATAARSATFSLHRVTLEQARRYVHEARTSANSVIKSNIEATLSRGDRAEHTFLSSQNMREGFRRLHGHSPYTRQKSADDKFEEVTEQMRRTGIKRLNKGGGE